MEWQAWIRGREETHSSIAVTLTHVTHVILTPIRDSHLLICTFPQRQTVHLVNIRRMLHITWWFRSVSCIYCLYTLGHSPWKGRCLQLLDKNDSSSHAVLFGTYAEIFDFLLRFRLSWWGFCYLRHIRTQNQNNADFQPCFHLGLQAEN